MASANTLAFYQTTIGKKAVVAVTGLFLFVFLIGHLVGNLQVFIGPDALNAYAAKLREVPALLWGVRIGLLACVVLHIGSSMSLAGRNSDARPVNYKHPRRSQVTSYAARTMVWSGPIIALYIVYHLLHLTLGYSGGLYVHDHQNVYNNVVHSFQQAPIAAVYIVASVLAGTHLYHGAWSWLQSLGANHVRYNRYRQYFAIGLAAFITGGNVLIPTAILAGAVPLTDDKYCYEELEKTPNECEDLERGGVVFVNR